MEHIEKLYRDWLEAFETIGKPVVSIDTAARILAVTYIHGNNESLVINKKYIAEIEHIQKMYHIGGGETPDGKLLMLVKHYVAELEQYRSNHRTVKDDEVIFRNYAPKWAHLLFRERYGIKLIN